jgi:hypothetical protein
MYTVKLVDFRDAILAMIDHYGQSSLASFKDLNLWSFGRSLLLPCR